MEKQNKATIMSASYNRNRNTSVATVCPWQMPAFLMIYLMFSTYINLSIVDLQMTFMTRICRSTDDAHLLPLSDDINLTKIEKSNNSDVVDNSIDLVISVPTNNVLTSSYRSNANDIMLTTISEIVVSWNTQSLSSCHKTVIYNIIYSISVFANTTGANLMNAPEHKSSGNLSFDGRNSLKDLKS